MAVTFRRLCETFMKWRFSAYPLLWDSKHLFVRPFSHFLRFQSLMFCYVFLDFFSGQTVSFFLLLRIKIFFLKSSIYCAINWINMVCLALFLFIFHVALLYLWDGHEVSILVQTFLWKAYRSWSSLYTIWVWGLNLGWHMKLNLVTVSIHIPNHLTSPCFLLSPVGMLYLFVHLFVFCY